MTSCGDSLNEYHGVVRDGRVELDGLIDWPEGTRVAIRAAMIPRPHTPSTGTVVIAGFGLAGRCVTDLLEQSGIPYIIVECNAETVRTQRALGRAVVEGDISEPQTLKEAGVGSAAALALTIPDEDAVLTAIEHARAINPHLYIIARTTYASRGIRAQQLGADDVIKSEQAVALQFHQRIKQKVQRGELVSQE